MVEDIIACFVPKHHEAYKIFALAKNICNYVFRIGKLEL